MVEEFAPEHMPCFLEFVPRLSGLPDRRHQEKSSFRNLEEIWNLLENLAILVGLAESGEILGKKVQIPWNPKKFGATVPNYAKPSGPLIRTIGSVDETITWDIQEDPLSSASTQDPEWLQQVGFPTLTQSAIPCAFKTIPIKARTLLYAEHKVPIPLTWVVLQAHPTPGPPNILCALGGGVPSLCWRACTGAASIPAQGPPLVIYPMLATICGTALGEAGTGSVSCRRTQWAKIAVLIADPMTGLQMRDAQSRSGGVGMHMTMILGTLRCSSPQDGDTKNETEGEGKTGMKIVDMAGDPLQRPHAWLYIGSHNFLVTAWGALTPEREWIQPGTECTCFVNYKLSIVLRLEGPEHVHAAAAWERPTWKYIEGTYRGWIPQDSRPAAHQFGTDGPQA
ncbi:hypothetical protein B0H14DRAFT_2601211 [Mycena olivaceomarginata]|nr:hypothetical protein B0H14DRAFT_2601211 [Mycena olivaceomarginata]